MGALPADIQCLTEAGALAALLTQGVGMGVLVLAGEAGAVRYVRASQMRGVEDDLAHNPHSNSSLSPLPSTPLSCLRNTPL